MILLTKRSAQREHEGLTERLVTISDPDSGASEAYRTLRTNLIHPKADRPVQVITITSPGPREGKSTICANLGVVLAQAGKKTLLMDCDFRKPGLPRLFGLPNLRGIVDVLAGEYNMQDVCQEPLANLRVVAVGPPPPDPAELAESERFAEFLRDARRYFDYVLLDASPIQSVSDPAIIGTQGDGVVLVFDAQHTRKMAVRQSMKSLEAVGANILGTVMNNAGTSQTRYAYTYRS
jgi:capsular exopolysaccharide synthesis family protein